MEHKFEFKKNVMENEWLDHNTRKMDSPQGTWRIAPKLREKHLQRTPDDVRTRAEAAAKCTKVTERRVLKKQAIQARAQHLVKCSLALGKKKVSRKPLTQFFVEGHFTGDREEWQKKIQRHCEKCIYGSG